MKEGLIKDTYELVLKEIQSLITIFYIFLVGIGMLFSYMKYAEFGINIFDYADVFYFLVAPFSDLKIILFTLITICIVFLLYSFDRYIHKKFPKWYSKVNLGMDKKSWFTIYRYISFFLLLIYYLYLFSGIYGDYTYYETKRSLTKTIKYTDNDVIKGKEIGKVNDIIFLLQGEKVKAIPINSTVKEFEIK